MINVITVPQGTASATTQDLVIEITEDLCSKVCVNSGATLSGNVAFSAGTPTVINGDAVVPITATGVIVMVGTSCGCNAKTRHFSETFNIAFQSTTDNTVTLTAGTNNVVEFTSVTCCHTTKAKMTTTLTAVIS